MPRWANKKATGESHAEEVTESKQQDKQPKGTISEALTELRDHKRRIEEAIASLEKL